MRYPIVMFVLSSILFAGNLFHINLHKKTLAAYEYTKEELSRCNAEYQKLENYYETQGVNNPFIGCLGFPGRDNCFSVVMARCMGDIAPDTEGYNRQRVLCEFMSIAARKLEHEKSYGVPEQTDDHPDYFTRCTASTDYDQCVKEAAKRCMPDNSTDKQSVEYRKAYDRCNRQFHNLQKDREVFLDIVELIQEDMNNIETGD